MKKEENVMETIVSTSYTESLHFTNHKSISWKKFKKKKNELDPLFCEY